MVLGGSGNAVGAGRARAGFRATLFVFACVAVAACATVALLVAYGAEDYAVREVPLGSLVVGDIDDIRYEVESREMTDAGEERIEGWCVLQGVTYRVYNYGNDTYFDRVYNHMEMAFLAGDQVLVVPTKLRERPDVTALLDDGIDYRFCGFVAQVPAGYADACSQAKPCLLLEDPKGAGVLYVLDADSDGAQGQGPVR